MLEVCQWLNQLFIVELHIIAQNVHSICLQCFSPLILDSTHKLSEDPFVDAEVLGVKLHSFAFNKLLVHSLNCLVMIQLRSFTISHMVFDFLSLNKQLKVQNSKFWRHKSKRLVNEFGEQVSHDICLHLGHGFFIFILHRETCVGQAQLDNVAHVHEDSLIVGAIVL